MRLQNILDELSNLAKMPASAKQLKTFQKTGTQLLCTRGSKNDDEKRALPLVFDQVDMNQLKALESSDEITNPNEFQRIILFFESLFQDYTISIAIRVFAAKLAFLKYSTTLPASGLPLDNPHIKGCLKWGHRVLDVDIADSQFDYHLMSTKVFFAEKLSGLYSRRSDNMNAAECYARLAMDALNSMYCKYPEVFSAQEKCIFYYEKSITADHTLRSPEVAALIRAIKIHIAFCKDIPENKKTYSLQGKMVWAVEEQRHASRAIALATGHLGKIIAKIPTVAEPTALGTPTSAGVFHHANNPVATNPSETIPLSGVVGAQHAALK